MKLSDLPPYSKETLKRARTLRKELTPTEWAVWNHLRDKKLGVKFRRQVPIGKFIVDFFRCLPAFGGEIGLVVEIDGSQHYLNENLEYDQQRTDYFAYYGIKTIRFNNNEVATNLDGIIETIMELVKKLTK